MIRTTLTSFPSSRGGGSDSIQISRERSNLTVFHDGETENPTRELGGSMRVISDEICISLHIR